MHKGAASMRIAVLYFAHETVTFLPNDTTLADFTYEGSPAKGEALLAHDARSYLGGFVKVAREYDDVELVGIESPLWPRTGTGSGWITEEAYETLLGRMIADLKAEYEAASAEDKAAMVAAIEAKVMPLLREGRIKPLMDSTFPLEQAAEAHRRMETSAHIGKIVLVV